MISEQTGDRSRFDTPEGNRAPDLGDGLQAQCTDYSLPLTGRRTGEGHGLERTIEEMQQTPNGVLARVRVWSEVVPLGGRLVGHMDHFYETYLYADGGVTLVGSEDPGPKPGFHRL